MNKKEIASMRKEFKSDSYKLRIKDIYTVYVQKDSDEIYHAQYNPFSMLDLDQQELFLKNFKKVFSGNIDEKLFELKFVPNNKATAQDHLIESIHCESDRWQELMINLIKSNFQDGRRYDEDVVFTFIRAEYYIATNKKEEENTVKEPFIFCSMNKTTQPKKALLFDYVNKEYKSNLVLDAMINLTSPIQGFMFPTIQQGVNADVNHVLYSTGKKNLPDLFFVKSVLNCDTEIVTTDTEVALFNQVLINLLGGKTNPKVISNVYHKIESIVEIEHEAEEDNEPVMLDYKDINHILVASGVEVEGTDTVKHALKEVVDNELYEFKAENLMKNKKITIETEPVKLSVEAQNLEKVRQVQHEGKLCLVIEIDKNVQVNGLTIETETVKE
ncbi:DUF4317 family protein [Virgibacillus halodenitrificans]|uniref:DUF4317 family protein n=1 Tax=Virgibacillus halodenitrificans TaxID=1482 RepID=UPI0013CEB011|nr:DUF4317 family protein [Virgibacillus halodenitrificans]